MCKCFWKDLSFQFSNGGAIKWQYFCDVIDFMYGTHLTIENQEQLQQLEYTAAFYRVSALQKLLHVRFFVYRVRISFVDG